MKKLIIAAALFAAMLPATEASAQFKSHLCLGINQSVFNGLFPKQHKCVRTNKPHSASVIYDTASTVLTVKLPSRSQGGTVEVYHDGAKVAGITANGGTTFSCTLREYGVGSYNVIVSNGNTVIDAKKYVVR